MIRRFRSSLVLLALLVHHDVNPARGDDGAPLDPVLRFSRARITLANEKQLFGTSLTLRGDSLSYFRVLSEESIGYEVKTPEEGDLRRISLKDIDRVEIPSGSRAALGAGIGAMAGTAIMLAIADDGDELEEVLFYGSILFVIPGAGIGALIGSTIEDWDTVYSNSDQ